MAWVFGELELDTDRRELRSRGALISLEPQAFDVLVHLVVNHDRVVPKEELMDQIWGGRFVSESAVTSRIKQARRAVGDDGQVQAFIRTHHGRGYRFVADVRESTGAAAATRASPPAVPSPRLGVLSPVLYPDASATQLAYQITGQGPPDIVLLPGSSFQLGWRAEVPAYHSFVDELGRLGRVIAVAWSAPPAELETAAQDVLSVMDDAASERAVVFGEAESGPLSAFLAATHPERVAGLLLYGTYATRSRPADTPPAASDPDVQAMLPMIQVPAMVLHRAGDPEAPVSAGRFLAARIPEAEYVELDGAEHSVGHASEQIIEAIAAFVEDAASAQAPSRSLSALVGLAGDDPAALAEVLIQLGGVRRQGPEKALIISFDGPATAMRALGSRRARGLLQGVGVAVAIDEVSSTSSFVAGHGVDVARLVAMQAAPGEVLMPNVIKDLLSGSGLVVEPAGTLELAHVGPHPVYRWIR